MYRYPHSSSAFLYGGAAWLKDALSDERDNNNNNKSLLSTLNNKRV